MAEGNAMSSLQSSGSPTFFCPQPKFINHIALTTQTVQRTVYMFMCIKLSSLLDYFGSSRPITRLLRVSTMKMSVFMAQTMDNMVTPSEEHTHAYIK